MEVYTNGIGDDNIIENIAVELAGSSNDITSQIINYNAYPIIEEEIKNAVAYNYNVSRILTVPVRMDGKECNVSVVVETKDGSLYISLVGGLPETLLKESANTLSKFLV
jgi:hypothetical protein